MGNSNASKRRVCRNCKGKLDLTAAGMVAHARSCDGTPPKNKTPTVLPVTEETVEQVMKAQKKAGKTTSARSVLKFLTGSLR